VRRFTPIELALAVSLLGCILAVAVPTFVREIHASRFVEPTDGLARLSASAVAFAHSNSRFPDSAPLTPAVPPRGTKLVDPPGTWDHPTWAALAFRPTPESLPHAYAFSFESTGDSFVAQARGDLDGDGILSTFEVKGTTHPGEAPRIEPGMYIAAELE